MIIYKCILSGDEMFTDIYKLKVNGAFYEVEGKMITRTDNAIDESLIGGNASAEEQTESLESSSTSGVDIVLNHKLQETTFDKTSYKVYIKDYMKAVKAKLQEENPEKVAGFVKEAQEAVKDVLKDFKDLQFFTGESMNPEAMVGLLNYREDGITPYMLFFKDGLVTEKC